VTIPIGNLNRLNGNDWSVTLPGAMFQALMSDRSTRVLQSPQVRATNGQKASLRLGDRYPYATGSFQPGIGGVGVSPLVSTQFQFADVGVNADVTPQIHGNDEVSMQIELEVSSIRERIDVGGLQQPVIGQRKVNHIIRVREGEVTLIGGLMGRIDSKTRGGIPGLTSIPVIGKIFSSDSEEKNDSELLVALIPHIVRYPDVNASNVKTIATGTEAIVKLNFAPRPEDVKPEAPKPPSPGVPPAGVPALAPAQRPPVPLVPPQQVPAQQSPVEQPAAPSDATAVPPPPPSPAAQPQTAEPAKPAADTGAEPRVLLVPSSKEVPLNQTFDLQVKVENVKDLFAVPMRMNYDPRFLQLVEVVEGSFMNGDGQKTVFTETKTDQPAGAVISLNRVPGAGGISGSGTLVTLRFKTQMRGTASVSFSDLTLRDGKLQTLPAGLPFLAVTIK
jgi:general secretion pathway protein D